MQKSRVSCEDPSVHTASSFTEAVDLVMGPLAGKHLKTSGKRQGEEENIRFFTAVLWMRITLMRIRIRLITLMHLIFI
jgi:hypothetical protein